MDALIPQSAASPTAAAGQSDFRDDHVYSAILLGDELIEYARRKVESGAFGSTSEVVREALRLLERSDQLESHRIEGLRRAWQEGADSADAGPLDHERRVGDLPAVVDVADHVGGGHANVVEDGRAGR